MTIFLPNAFQFACHVHTSYLILAVINPALLNNLPTPGCCDYVIVDLQYRNSFMFICLLNDYFITQIFSTFFIDGFLFIYHHASCRGLATENLLGGSWIGIHHPPCSKVFWLYRANNHRPDATNY